VNRNCYILFKKKNRIGVIPALNPCKNQIGNKKKRDEKNDAAIFCPSLNESTGILFEFSTISTKHSSCPAAAARLIPSLRRDLVHVFKLTIRSDRGLNRKHGNLCKVSQRTSL
jgi:hypothetical protein